MPLAFGLDKCNNGCTRFLDFVGRNLHRGSRQDAPDTSIMETFERFKIVEDGAMDWTRVWSGANDAELKMFDVAGTVIFVR